MQPSTESSIDSLIQMEVTQVIRERCQCDFQESFIGQAMLLCDQQQPTQVLYRANITSYGSYSANQLVGYIEDWVKQGATFTTGVFIVTFDPDCPVRINDLSDPICATIPTSASVVTPTSTSVVTPTSTQSTPDMLVVIATSASVVVLTIIVMALFIIYLLNQKKKM